MFYNMFLTSPSIKKNVSFASYFFKDPFGSQSHGLTLVSWIRFISPITELITAEFEVLNSLPVTSFKKMDNPDHVGPPNIEK